MKKAIYLLLVSSLFFSGCLADGRGNEVKTLQPAAETSRTNTNTSYPPPDTPTITVQNTPVEDTEPVEPNLFEEADAEATKFIDDLVVNCGELYYIRTNFELRACKVKPWAVVENGKVFYPRELTEADRLNGVDPNPEVTFSGILKVHYELCRSYITQVPYASGKWGLWTQNETHKPKIIRKVRGKWVITNESDYGQGSKFIKIGKSKCVNNEWLDVEDIPD